jgi:hypothetical protein
MAELSQPSDQIGLITFSGAVTIYDLNRRPDQSFTEFDASLYLKRPSFPFFINGLTGFSAVRAALSSLGHTRGRRSSPALALALEWAAALLDGYGGRLLLFRSAEARDAPPQLLASLRDASASLCLIEECPSALGRAAEATSGVVCALGRTARAASVFSLATAWDACASFRAAPNVRVSRVLGPCSVIDNGVTVFPVLTAAQSVFYELAADRPGIGNCHFQLAVRYTDDSGVRKVRVINGRLPFAAAPSLPVDEAALALCIHRGRLHEPEDGPFPARVALARAIAPADGMLPIFLFAGMHQDRTFVAGASVEAFALSNVPSRIASRDRAIRVVWTGEVVIAWPPAIPEEEDALREAARHFGIPETEIVYVQSEDEFEQMLPNAAAAAAWYRNVRPIYV